jgi:hypothetical protein
VIFLKRPSVEEMERALGLDKIKPIKVSPSMQEELNSDGDYFRQWYEDELWKLYQVHFIYILGNKEGVK